MIPAKIIEISDKVTVKYGDIIAEVENVKFVNDILNIMLNYFIIKFSETIQNNFNILERKFKLEKLLYK